MVHAGVRPFSLGTLLVVAADAICLFVAIVLAYMLLYPGGNAALFSSFPGAIAIVIAMVLLTGTMGVYRESVQRRFWPAVVRTSVAFAVILPGLHWVFFRLPDGSVCAPCLAGTMAIAFGLKVTILLLSGASHLRQRRVMILGVGSDAASVSQMLESSDSRSVSVVGFYTPFADQPVDPALPKTKILGGNRSIGEITGQHQINEIVIAMRERRGGSLPLSELLNCKLKGVKVVDLSTFYEQTRSRVRIDLLRESWFIFGDGFRQGIIRKSIKRAFDILASAVLLILAAPVMIATALAIRLESPGPVLYRQQRVGLGGRLFDIIKFRSMRADAEKDGTPQWAQAGDARVTRVGRLIRLTRIDELPQLFSVLAGTMSLVGPRPERPFFVAQLEKEIPFYNARHSVKPGVTGWAQVRHKYGASIADSSDKLEYDLFYVKNHSLLFDLLILFYSIRVVVLAEGSR